MSGDQKTHPRLDSWKAIADYLNRDVRTVRRWERTLGLPVRRIPGARGHSVFANVPEIEAWLHQTPAISERDSGAAPSTDSMGPAVPRRQTRAWMWLTATAAAIALAALGWRGLSRTGAAANPVGIQVTPAAVIATDADGAEAWRYSFSPDEEVSLASREPTLVTTNNQAGAYVLLGSRVRIGDRQPRSGQLLRIAGGKLERQFAFDDQLWFFGSASNTFGPPWAMTAFRLSTRGGRTSIAVAAHHWTWWPSVVTVLDEDFHRQGTFVNAGWVESLEWVSADRLIVAGYFNQREAGMVALLDAGALTGQSPADAGGEFDCPSCGRDPALRYIVLPRSELNRVTASNFNRARVALAGDQVLIRTIEVEERNHNLVDAVYEFSPALELRRASFSDRYWDLHRTLEAEGKIHHTRETCPDRNGPHGLQQWEPGAGWRALEAGSK